MRQANILKEPVGYDAVIDMRFVTELQKELGIPPECQVNEPCDRQESTATAMSDVTRYQTVGLHPAFHSHAQLALAGGSRCIKSGRIEEQVAAAMSPRNHRTLDRGLVSRARTGSRRPRSMTIQPAILMRVSIHPCVPQN